MVCQLLSGPQKPGARSVLGGLSQHAEEGRKNMSNTRAGLSVLFVETPRVALCIRSVCLP